MRQHEFAQTWIQSETCNLTQTIQTNSRTSNDTRNVSGSQRQIRTIDAEASGQHDHGGGIVQRVAGSQQLSAGLAERNKMTKDVKLSSQTWEGKDKKAIAAQLGE